MIVYLNVKSSYGLIDILRAVVELSLKPVTGVSDQIVKIVQSLANSFAHASFVSILRLLCLTGYHLLLYL